VSDVLVAIVGARRRIPAIVAAVTATMEQLDRSTIIVTGCAEGTDCHVRRECKRLGFRLIECHARQIDGKWAGRWAGPERNTMIARLAQRVIAWPASPEFPEVEREKSSGTWNCVDQFRGRGKPVDVREDAWRT
jgi:hypothetical protein